MVRVPVEKMIVDVHRIWGRTKRLKREAMDFTVNETFKLYMTYFKRIKKEYGSVAEIIPPDVFDRLAKASGDAWGLPPLPSSELPHVVMVERRKGIGFIQYPVKDVIEYLFKGKEPDAGEVIRRIARVLDKSALPPFLRGMKRTFESYLTNPEGFTEPVRIEDAVKPCIPSRVRAGCLKLPIEMAEVVEVLSERLKLNEFATGFVKKHGVEAVLLGIEDFRDLDYKVHPLKPVLVATRDTPYQEYLFREAFRRLRLWDYVGIPMKVSGIAVFIPPSRSVRVRKEQLPYFKDELEKLAKEMNIRIRPV